VNNTPKQ